MTSKTLRAVRWLMLSSLFIEMSCTERPADRATQSRQKTAGSRAAAASSSRAITIDTPNKTAVAGSAIRRAQKSGGWYPADRVEAITEMERSFRTARSAPTTHNKPIALVVPHAGWRYSGVAAAAAYKNLHRGDYRRVVLLGPAHGHAFAGFSLPKYDAYETPLGQVPLCPESNTLRDGELLKDVSEADHGEHSLELQLPWLQETLGSFCMIPILVGVTNAAAERALAQTLATLPRADTLFVISSDFVHYGVRFGYTPFGNSVTQARERVFELENQAIDFLSHRNASGFRKLMADTDATICGNRGILVLLELLQRIAPEAEAVTFAHYSSAELTEERDEGGSVGYVALGFSKPGNGLAAPPLRVPVTSTPCAGDATLDETMGQKAIQLAKATLETKLRGNDALSRELSELTASTRFDCRQAVFVTLRAKGLLRGCVGQVQPEYPLFEAIVRAAIDAALNDQRFEPVTPSELAGLSFGVTVLSVPNEVNSYRDIVLGKHGMILSLEGHRALFLPQVPAEQGWNLEQTLRALSHKAGLPEDAWKDARARYSVFTGSVFEEPSQTHQGVKSP